MEDFLNSENFYKMAKEYNEKYNKVASLETGDTQKLQDVLAKMEKLCNVFRKTFSGGKFVLVQEKLDDLEKEIFDIEKDYGMVASCQNKIYFFSNKRLAGEVVKVLNDLFLMKNGEKGDKIEILQKKFYDVISAILAVI